MITHVGELLLHYFTFFVLFLENVLPVDETNQNIQQNSHQQKCKIIQLLLKIIPW